jgi:hypothetical protein
MTNPSPIELSPSLAPNAMETTNDAKGSKVKIITAPVEKSKCISLAHKYK